jgi:hypothetical protein
MGFGGSSVKKCTIDIQEYKFILQKQSILAEVLDVLGESLSTEKMSAGLKLPRIPAELATDPSALVGRGDFAEDNAITRYNSFIGLYNQLKPADRLEQANLTMKDLLVVRTNLTTEQANLCV